MTMQGTASFGGLLKHYRVATGLTQEELAERAGLSARGISDLERGVNRAPRPVTVTLLARAMRLAPHERAALIGAARDAGQAAPGTRADSPARPVVAPPPTTLVGREREEAAVTYLLGQEHVRLLTLTGPGGVGKTRLALHIAHELSGCYADGIIYVPLAAIDEPRLVVPTIAQSAGLREMGGQSPVDAVITYLRPKDVLVVLDNVEHVRAAASEVAHLLAQCPRLRVLATSRAALRVRGEQEFMLPPLEMPGPDVHPAGDIVRYAAVELFLHRARAVRPDFRLTPASAPVVAAICRRLDGLPLAIELAAARVKVLSPWELLARLERRLPVLVDGAVDLPPRQQTMRDAIAWSYDLLDEERQTVFRQLAVFAGGCTLDAVEAVCALPDMLGIVTSLVETSLVQASLPASAPVSSPAPTPSIDPHAAAHTWPVGRLAPFHSAHEGDAGGEMRFALLQTVREYGAELLDTRVEAPALRRRHALFYLALAEQGEGGLRGPEQAVWLDRLEREHDNMRAALQWACEYAGDLASGAGALGLRLAGALWRFWHGRGYIGEGRGWLEVLLADAENSVVSGDISTQASIRAKALCGAGVLAMEQGDYAQAIGLTERGVSLRRDLGDRQGLTEAFNTLGLVALDQGDYARATALHEENLAMRREGGDTRGVAVSLLNLGIVRLRWGDDARAAMLLQESLALWRRLGDTRGAAVTLNNLGATAHARGDHERATALCQESLGLCRELGDKEMAYALTNLAGIARDQGDIASAAALYAESLALFWRGGERAAIAGCLEGLADVASVGGKHARAIRLLAAAATLRTVIGAPVWPLHQANHTSVTSRARGALDDDLFAAEWTVGQSLSLDQAIDEALRDRA